LRILSRMRRGKAERLKSQLTPGASPSKSIRNQQFPVQVNESECVVLYPPPKPDKLLEAAGDNEPVKDFVPLVFTTRLPV
jgi:hypothetical protein